MSDHASRAIIIIRSKSAMPIDLSRDVENVSNISMVYHDMPTKPY
jgi:nitrate reductase NapAB chaperone NapD